MSNAFPIPQGTSATPSAPPSAAKRAEHLSSSSASPGDEDLDLACGETIPGSPVHPSSDPAAAEAARQDLPESATPPAPSKHKSSSSSVSAGGELPTRPTAAMEAVLALDCRFSNLRFQFLL